MGTTLSILVQRMLHARLCSCVTTPGCVWFLVFVAVQISDSAGYMHIDPVEQKPADLYVPPDVSHRGPKGVDGHKVSRNREAAR